MYGFQQWHVQIWLSGHISYTLSMVWLILSMKSQCPTTFLLQMHVWQVAVPPAKLASPTGDWFYTHWHMDFPDLQHHHINMKELFSVVLAACFRALLWHKARMLWYTLITK